MATKKNETLPDLSAEQVQEKLNTALIRNEEMEGVTIEQAFDIFEKTDPKFLEQISGAEYFEFKQPGEYFFLFMGMDEFNSKEKGIIPAVKLQNRAGENFINANTILTNTLKKVQKIPSFVKITYAGDKKGATGNKYKDLNIQVLGASLKAD